MKQIARLTLIVLTIALSLLSMEAILRIFPSIVARQFNSIGWNHWTVAEANDAYTTSFKEYNQMYSYDPDIGYIDSYIVQYFDTLPTDQQSYRILVLGDSVSAVGQYVPKLEKQLNEKYGGQVSVVNSGIIGYDTKLELLFLKKYAIHTKPNLVLLQFNINDFDGTPVFMKNPDNTWQAFNANKAIQQINPQLFSHSQLYRLLAVTYLNFTKEKTEYHSVVKGPLSEMASFLHDQNIDFLVVFFPKFEQSDDADYKHQVFNQIIQDLSLNDKVLDLTPAYQPFDLTEISQDTTHPNEKGDQIASDKIFEQLQPTLEKVASKSAAVPTSN